jgi:hypothetical protein
VRAGEAAARLRGAGSSAGSSHANAAVPLRAATEQESDVQLTPGGRFRSAVCDTEVVVVRPPAAAGAFLSCGGVPMVPRGEQPDGPASIRDGHDGGTKLGKRYGLADDPVEVLVTKAGQGALSLSGRLLEAKDPKPLPSSD